MEYLISVILGFLIGIIPINFFNSKNPECNILKTDMLQSVICILFELLKGVLVVLLVRELLEYEFAHIMIAITTATLSYGIFVGFKYKIREGQFVALGGLLLIVPTVSFIWLVIWLVSYIYKRNYNFSLISSTLLTGLVCVTSSKMLNSEYWFTNPTTNSNLEFKILMGILFTIVLITQIDNFKFYFLKK